MFGKVAMGADQGVVIELNRLSPVKNACRMSLVFTNMMDVAVEALAIETVLFNKQDSVERFLVLKSRPLSPKKIRVQQFDVTGIDCERFGKLLLNDVKECKAATLDQKACVAGIRPSSKAGVPFVSTAAAN
ncbi:MAG: hypothetical protein MPJ78_15860 [Hyphomicrobiaceae bacterium]|nr:hypothetical protein [Hyphomicrobiaceae bacterium]